MKTAYEIILSRVPWLVRWVFYIFWAGAVAMSWLFWQGWSAKDKSDKYFTAIAEEVFERKISPINTERHTRYSGIRSELIEIKDEQKNQGAVIYRMDGKLDQALSTR